jgi:HD superfamily phosphodiesterase
MSLSTKLDTLTSILYQGRDESHGIKHVNKVYQNCLEILDNLTTVEKIALSLTDLDENDIHDIIICSALLHDAWDHKYIKNSNQEAEKKEFVSYYLIPEIKADKMKIILNIIDNISFSKEKSGKRQNLGKYEILRNIVSDADKLEAISDNGIPRSILYNLQKNNIRNVNENYINQISDDIIQHYHYKLSKLTDKYIVIEYAKNIAKKLDTRLKLIVSEKSILSMYIKKFLIQKNINLNC